jgi:hypothetical protein
LHPSTHQIKGTFLFQGEPVVEKLPDRFPTLNHPQVLYPFEIPSIKPSRSNAVSCKGPALALVGDSGSHSLRLAATSNGQRDEWVKTLTNIFSVNFTNQRALSNTEKDFISAKTLHHKNDDHSFDFDVTQ